MAYYIYSKFGQHLLTFNSTTKHEVIPLYGEHIRRTNEKEFDVQKNLLQNRKASSARAHKLGLRRDLSQKNLPVPKMLGSISNAQAASKIELSRFSRQGLSSARAFAESENRGPAIAASYRSTAGDMFTQPPEMQDIPAKHCRINKDIDTYYFQQYALLPQEIQQLYTAKCRDILRKEDANQFEKFMTHVLLKAKKRRLNLSNCNLGLASAQVLAGQLMMFNHNFASYNLEFNELGDAGVAIIANALAVTQHITSLNLDMNNIQSEGAEHLARALGRNTSLIHLSLGSGQKAGNNRNRILEKGAFHLSKVLCRNQYLMFLDLTGNSIGNKGATFLLEAVA